jgi:hypothetical protein
MRVEGQTFEARMRVGDRELLLNGVGVRAVAWFKGYAAGLYLVASASTPEAAVAMEGPKRLRMRMLQDVPTEEFVKAIDKGFARNTPVAAQPALADRRAEFDRQVQGIGTVAKGDVIDLDFEPGRGFMMLVNGRPRGEPIAGADFYGAVLRIFLGERPVDKNLKAGLLGLRAPA